MNQNGPVAIAIAASVELTYCSPQATSPVPPVRIKIPIMAFFFQLINKLELCPLLFCHKKSRNPAIKNRNQII